MRGIPWLLALGAAFVAPSFFRALRPRSRRGDVVLVTGASRGLGLLVAREYARLGADLVLLARSPEELERAQADLAGLGVAVLVLPCDVSDDVQVKAAVRAALRRFGKLDVVVNVAGEIEVGPIEAMERQDFVRAMSTNFWGPYNVIVAVLPLMRVRGGGTIVNVSSIGGILGVPHLVPYSASKFALNGLSLGLRAELAKDNIRVVTICPGLMRTGSPPFALYKGDHRAEYAWFSVADSLPLLSMSAERAARQIVRAERGNVARAILSAPAKLGAVAMTLAPGLTTRLLGAATRLLPRYAQSAGPARAHLGVESAAPG